MKNQNPTPSAITRDCTNFKNYLKNQFEIENFGEFICTYTFPLEEIEALKDAAAKAGKTPVSLRLYYGCEADGTHHRLYISLLDKEGDIVVDSGTTNSTPPKKKNLTSTHAAANGILAVASLAEERKCPPGGTSDRFISALFV